MVKVIHECYVLQLCQIGRSTSMLDAHLHVQSGCTTDIMVNIIIIQNKKYWYTQGYRSGIMHMQCPQGGLHKD